MFLVQFGVGSQSGLGSWPHSLHFPSASSPERHGVTVSKSFSWSTVESQIVRTKEVILLTNHRLQHTSPFAVSRIANRYIFHTEVLRSFTDWSSSTAFFIWIFNTLPVVQGTYEEICKFWRETIIEEQQYFALRTYMRIHLGIPSVRAYRPICRSCCS